ncbi:aspartic peptidase domain-containing protein [Mycena maculata]|uniref:Aspartic peptidase domain-containing protein n=1 Tax=Mycena maculata TaxID=230809 RepID=A0AAD7NA76_9AGAR|nr:aspartic peptidase domain-containing protein [Mycena maculata]
MVLALTLLPAILLALCVAAGPVLDDSFVSLPISRRFNFTGSATVVQKDLARIQAIQSRKSGVSARAVISEPVSNQVVSYIAAVGIGSPATTYQLIVDTGSSNTWVGAEQKYVVTSTSVKSTQAVAVSYGSGSFSGTEYTDTVTLATGLVIPAQSIGVASKSSGFSGVDGIMGIGPVDLTEGTLIKSPTTLIPTVTDNLFKQGTITSDLIGISFEPITSEDDNNGSIAFGGTDSTKFTGSVAFTPVTSTSPAGDYWGINQSISYNGATILTSTAGIVDTGTTLIYIASNAFDLYQTATGATADASTGLLKVTATQFAALENLNFVIGGVTYALTPNAQIWPRSLNTAIGGSASSIYLVVANWGAPEGEGLDFINGYAFLERFYSVFDTGNKQVGFATTAFTTATTN